jgi:hypothetical protein
MPLLAKFNPTGSTLLYSTYLGGNADDVGYGIAVDTSGSAYVAGITQSDNFPTANAMQSSYEGSTDVFVTKLEPCRVYVSVFHISRSGIL